MTASVLEPPGGYPRDGMSQVHIDFFLPSTERRPAATNPWLWANAAGAVAMTAIAVRLCHRRHQGVST